MRLSPLIRLPTWQLAPPPVLAWVPSGVRRLPYLFVISPPLLSLVMPLFLISSHPFAPPLFIPAHLLSSRLGRTLVSPHSSSHVPYFLITHAIPCPAVFVASYLGNVRCPDQPSSNLRDPARTTPPSSASRYVIRQNRPDPDDATLNLNKQNTPH